jgi:predicted ATP-grasp superfamily ATP-dependent carboligase
LVLQYRGVRRDKPEMDGPAIVIVGASVRAAAFAALRAGLRPWAFDLFADRDLCAACRARTVPYRSYPARLSRLVCQALPGPWLYTGGLENHPDIVGDIARERPLWGNDANVLRAVRDPFLLADALHAAGIPVPAVRRSDETPERGRWLAKPIVGAGGAGIRFVRRPSVSGRRRTYFQEFIDGPAQSAVFVAGGDGCKLLGVTRQLVGAPWVHASAFRYCGSIGPLALTKNAAAAWQRLGAVVTEFAGLRGLFGVDAIIRDGVPWPVEVNPRFTASVEVLEYATGLRSLALHRRVFDPAAPVGPIRFRPGAVGKAVYYAARQVVVPEGGPWEDELRERPLFVKAPRFADIPAAGQRIAAGRPILTMFSAGQTIEECEMQLRETAREMDEWFLNPTTGRR